MMKGPHSCCLLLFGIHLVRCAQLHTTQYTSTRTQTTPTFLASCSFLCYSGVLSEADGCVCRMNMCRPGSCKGGEVCQTKLINRRAVASCCPLTKHKACGNHPRFHARRGRTLYYFRPETQTCHRFVPTRYDNRRYFRSYFDCVTSCTCRNVLHTRH